MAPRPPRKEETGRELRGVLLTLAAVGLSVGVLASLGPSRPAAAHRRAVPPAAATSTTLAPAGSVPAGTTGAAHPAGEVAVLAPAGSPATAGIEQKLTKARYSLVHHAPIPASWVASLQVPLVRYPSGLLREAMAVATALGLNSSVVGPEAAGTSDGAQVVEVYVPVS